MYYKLAPSILAADFTRLGEQVKEVYGACLLYTSLLSHALWKEHWNT